MRIICLKTGSFCRPCGTDMSNYRHEYRTDMSTICRPCGTEISNIVPICRQFVMICQPCGTGISNMSTFCRTCGTENVELWEQISYRCVDIFVPISRHLFHTPCLHYDHRLGLCHADVSAIGLYPIQSVYSETLWGREK